MRNKAVDAERSYRCGAVGAELQDEWSCRCGAAGGAELQEKRSCRRCGAASVERSCRCGAVGGEER